MTTFINEIPPASDWYFVPSKDADAKLMRYWRDEIGWSVAIPADATVAERTVARQMRDANQRGIYWAFRPLAELPMQQARDSIGAMSDAIDEVMIGTGARTAERFQRRVDRLVDRLSEAANWFAAHPTPAVR